MTTETTYRVTLSRPSRSKCPNAWARRDGADGWLADTFTARHGDVILLGGNIKRSTRTEKVSERITIDEAGSWSAWSGAGGITIEAEV